ncbi:MAG: hypothetical protein CMF39_00745 [Legionellaceae bacterium]|nr:hypothetical protein [Legionellaceae bacterium]|tara:strand:+ start:117 stop:1547 length:1431 start_codon:yes stop_codon:yes gene_type:complete
MKFSAKFAINTLIFAALNVTAFANSNAIFINDIHFNPFTACGTQVPCRMIDELLSSPASQWDALLKNRSEPFSTYGQDPNYKLMSSSLNAVKQVVNDQHAQFTLYLGDFLGHHYDGDKGSNVTHKGFYYYVSPPNQTPAEYKTFVKKSMAVIIHDIRAAAGDHVPVYFLLGNNDSDRGDNVFPSQEYLQNTATDFNLTSSQTQTFLTGGYYLQPIDKNNEVIMLNSNVFSPSAQLPDNKPPVSIAQNQMRWLSDQLANAKKENLSVWIAMHIPPGIDTFNTDHEGPGTKNPPVPEWLPEYNEQFRQLILQYSSIIRGIFAAHMHKDAFRMINDNDGKAINYISINPAISPNYGNNAAFKDYSYDNSFNPTNYSVYYADLSTPNRDQLNWQLEYSFDDAYHQPASSTLLSGYRTIANDPSLKSGNFQKLYYQFYAVNYRGFNGRWLPYYYCAIKTIDSKSYIECENKSQPTLNTQSG